MDGWGGLGEVGFLWGVCIFRVQLNSVQRQLEDAGKKHQMELSVSKRTVLWVGVIC